MHIGWRERGRRRLTPLRCFASRAAPHARRPAQVTRKNDGDGANLEPNHTHQLLVDTGKQGRQAWGSEIRFRNELEIGYCLSRRRKVPLRR